MKSKLDGVSRGKWVLASVCCCLLSLFVVSCRHYYCCLHSFFLRSFTALPNTLVFFSKMNNFFNQPKDEMVDVSTKKRALDELGPEEKLEPEDQIEMPRKRIKLTSSVPLVLLPPTSPLVLLLPPPPSTTQASTMTTYTMATLPSRRLRKQ